MKLSFKKFALIGLSLIAMFVLVGCEKTTTTTTTALVTTQSDTQKVQAVLDGITLGDVSAVVANLTLPTASVNGVSISWATEDADVLTNTGEITVPDYTTGDQIITLTLSATLNAVTLTKTFDVTVKAETATAFLTRIGAGIIIDSSDSIIANFKLPSLSQGATITWASSNAAVATISAAVGNDGFYTVTVVRPKIENGGANTSVTLTATLVMETTTVTAEKSIRVIAEPAAVVYTSFETMHSTAVLNDYVDITGTVYSIFKLGYFIHDTAGKYVAIYTTEANVALVALGDIVRIKGLYKNYNTLYQISNLTLQTVVSRSNPITASKIVLPEASDLLDLNPANKLIHGQTYTITVTPQLRGAYNNVYLYQGDQRVATVYYNSSAASIALLTANVGKEIKIDVVYYTFYSGSSVLTPGVSEVYVTFFGTASDIQLTDSQLAQNDVDALVVKTSVVSGEVATLPASIGVKSTVVWSLVPTTYATLVGATLTYAEVTSEKGVALMATITYPITGKDPIVTHRVYSILISTYAEKVAQDKAALTLPATSMELEAITLPTTGLNGSTITWVLTVTDNANIAAGKLNLEIAGATYDVIVTATMAFTAAPAVTETKVFTITVSPIVIITEFGPYNAKTGADWTIANDVFGYFRGIVSAKQGTAGFFIQDASGDGLYIHGANTVNVGDEVVVYGKTAVYSSVRQLGSWVLKAVLTTGNTPFVTTMTLAELAAIVPTFYQYASRLLSVTGLVVKEFRSNGYLDLVWANVVVGETTTVYMLSFSYNNDTYRWLNDIYDAGDALPAFNFVLYNIYAITTFNISGISGLAITDQQAVDFDEDALPASITFDGTNLFPVAKYATYTITNVSATLLANITNAGVVTLPDGADITGTVTVSVSKGTATPASVVIAVTIKGMTAAQKLAAAVAGLPTTLALAYHYTIPTLYGAVFSNLVVPAGLTGNVVLSADATKLEIVRPAGTAPVVGSITLTVTVGSATQNVEIPLTIMGLTDLFFSEYIEGGSNNKAFEIYNGTGASVDLSAYSVELYANGVLIAGTKVTLSGTLANGDVYIIYNSGSVTAITSIGDLSSTLTYYNGDDALVLKHNGVIIDSIGQVGVDPGTQWGTTGVVSTLNMTLVRKSSITVGDANAFDAYNPTSEWDAYPQDTFTYLGSHTVAE
jgi:hypothetical protein